MSNKTTKKPQEETTLAAKVARLEAKRPRDARMVEAVIDMILAEPLMRHDDMTWTFISDAEKDVLEIVFDSLIDMRSGGNDTAGWTYPEGLINALHKLMSDVLFRNPFVSSPKERGISERFNLFKDADDESEGAA